MNSEQLLAKALSIEEPWLIENVEFSSEKQRLDVYISFKRGSTFKSEDVEGEYKAYDTIQKTWRHLNFFQHECYLHCRTPRIKTNSNQIRLVSPPWSGRSNGFTLLFEALVLQLCSQMTVLAVSRLINESDDKIWRMLDSYVEEARFFENFESVEKIGIDETSKTKGHDYITIFADLEQKRTLFVTEGKDHSTVDRFVEDLKSHQGNPEQIKQVSCDMSPAFIKGINDNFANAEITFDKFHLVKLVNEAVDEVRKQEVKTQPLLKKTKYIFLKNQDKLTDKQRAILEMLKLPKYRLKSVRALHIRENFQAIYQAQTSEEFEFWLKKWYFWATHSRLKPIIKVAKTIKSHWDGIVAFQRSQINNGFLEALNSIIQAAKARARGFSSTRNMKIVVYLLTGKLNFQILNPHFLS